MAQAGDVVERFFAGKVDQIKPVLDKVDAQHTFKSNREATIASRRVVRFDHGTQISLRHDAVHRVQNSSRRVGLRCCSNPVSYFAAIATVCCFIAVHHVFLLWLVRTACEIDGLDQRSLRLEILVELLDNANSGSSIVFVP